MTLPLSDEEKIESARRLLTGRYAIADRSGIPEVGHDRMALPFMT